MAALKDVELRQDYLSPSVKSITKSWDTIKRNIDEIREEIASLYFKMNPERDELFMSQKFEEKLTDAVISKRFYKHSCAVVNFMENLIEFFNGNEEIKPILFVLGKSHKVINVNEKMFLEMKDAICKVIRTKVELESSRAWDIVLQYTFSNYVFEGMHI